jgi:hypothetical protein
MDELKRNLERAAAHITAEGMDKGLSEASRALRSAILSSPLLPRRMGKVEVRQHGPISRNVFRKKVQSGLTEYADQIGYIVGVSAKAFYAYFIERGWKATGRKHDSWRSMRRMKYGARADRGQMSTASGTQVQARPFLGPVFDSMRPELERIIAEKIAEAVRTAGK